jgi:murein DD-endopeptidase MepM/ murein hydrolase activator NlpD
MKKFFYSFKKLLSQQITLMLVFHTTYGTIKKNFSLAFIIFLFILWTTFTAVSVFFATRHFDYWSAKIKAAVLGTKYEYLNKELSKTWELLAKVEENDRAIRKLLGMKSKKEIIINSPDMLNQGGPLVQQAKFLQEVSRSPQDVNLLDYKKHFDLIEEYVKKQIESHNEIYNFIKLQKELYRYTPLIWPCYGKVTSPYGYRIHPVYGVEQFHTGIDIANKPGTKIYATADGVVKFTGWMEGYGKVVVVEHKFGYTTVYAHLSVIKVKQGQKISRGEVVGLMGDTGTTTGPHLHYEVWKDGKLCNPIKFVNIEDFFKG